MSKNASLGEAVLEFTGDDSKLNKSATTAKSNVENILGKVGTGMKAVGVGVLATGTAVVAVGAGIYAMTAKAAGNADEILVASTKYGIATDQLQKMKYAAELVDVPLETMLGSFNRLTMSIGASKDGTGEQAELFKQLGVSIFDSNGQLRSSNDIWLETIDALGKVENETERNIISQKLFGRSAMELNPLIAAGTDTLKALGDEAQRSGYVLSESQLNALGKVDDAIERVKTGSESITKQLAATFAPGVASVVEAVSGYMGQLGGIMGDESLTSAEKIAKGTELVKTIVTDITTELPKMIESGIGIIKSLAQGIINALPTLIPAVVEIVMSLVGFLIEMLPVLAEGAIQLVVGLAQGLADGLPKLIPAAVQMIMTIIQVIFDNLPLILKAGLDLVVGLVTGIVDSIPVLMDAIPQLIESIVAVLIQLLPVIGKAAIEIIIALINGLIGAIPKILEAIPEIIVAIVDGLIEGGSSFNSAGAKLMEGFWEGLQSWFTKIWDGVTEFCAGIVKAIQDALGIHSPSAIGFNLGSNFVGSMGLGIEDRLNSVAGIASRAAGQIASSAEAGAVTQSSVNHNYYLTGNYQYQSQTTLMDQVRMLNLLGGAG